MGCIQSLGPRDRTEIGRYASQHSIDVAMHVKANLVA